MKKYLGFLALLAAGLIFGSFGIWIRILDRELLMFQQIAFRNIIGFLMSLGLLLVMRKPLVPARGAVSKIPLFLYALSIPVSVVLYNVAILHTGIAVTLFSLYLGSLLMSIILGHVMFHEHITRQKGIAFVFAVLGLVCFLYPFSITDINIGFFAAFAAGLADGAANAFRKLLSSKVDIWWLVFVTMLAGIIIAYILLVVYGQPMIALGALSGTTWFVGILFGLILMLVNYLVLYGFGHFDLQLGTIVLTTELLFGAVFGFVFFQEMLKTNELVGGLLIVVAVLAANIPKKRKSGVI